MGTLTCVQCNNSWYARGVSNNTICEKCSQPKEPLEDDELSEKFEDIVKEMMLDEEIDMLKDINWSELELLGAEYVALQLRWKILTMKKGSVE
ncbi:hypothetical protein [Salipaludibacillus sp. CF4.18]|uniref:hypothetical protein n=1 Tax=Salipaludibacillus sp. CF4.18 TaxID=3373081 RepID=UPI003EE6091F